VPLPTPPRPKHPPPAAHTPTQDVEPFGGGDVHSQALRDQCAARRGAKFQLASSSSSSSA
jgi:hypothetical protein